MGIFLARAIVVVLCLLFLWIPFRLSIYVVRLGDEGEIFGLGSILAAAMGVATAYLLAHFLQRFWPRRG